MKRNYIFILIILVVLALLSGLIYFFWPTDNNGNFSKSVEGINTPSETTRFSSPQVDISNQFDTNPALQNNVQILTPKMNAFVKKVESILQGVQSRESKIISLMNILQSSQSDDEKIATLQSLASLKPIEYVDDLMALAKSDKESDKVRSEALRTLSQAYLLSDEEVQRIGGSSVYVQMEKVSQYVDSVISDKNTPPELYNAALQSYAFMKPDDASILAKDIFNKNNVLRESESNFFNDAMFANKQNLTSLLPVIQKNPDKMNDKMASQIAVMTADPIVLGQLNQTEKQQVIAILKAHKLDLDNPMLQVESDTINAKIEEIEKSL